MPKHYRKKRKPASMVEMAATPAGRRLQDEEERRGGLGGYSAVRGAENTRLTAELDTPEGARVRKLIREGEAAERAHRAKQIQRYRQQMMRRRRQRPPLDL